MADVPVAPKARLIITSMTLENFKSYKGKQEIGPFHHRFSSVVGPNGSGKSNVIDALLFVFGKRAKQLRLSKVSELIHTSEGNLGIPMAKVSVHFQQVVDHLEGEGFDVIEGTELVVSRTANRDNTSKYYIDGKGSNFTEVTDLLKGHGVDLDHNRFMILQGEVEQISLMKPKAQTEHETGLLEYLEDIIGSNKYIEDIERTGEELDKVTEERAEKVNRVKHVEKERDGLAGAKSEAEEYLVLQHDLNHKKCTLYQVYHHDAQGNADKLSEEKTELSAKLEEEKAKMAEVRKELDAKAKLVNQGKKEYELEEKEMKESKDQFGVFERQDIKHREDLKHLKSKEKKLNEAAAREGRKQHSAEQEASRLLAEVGDASRVAAGVGPALKKEEDKLQAIYDELKSETQPMREEMEKKQEELIPWAKAVAEAQSAVDVDTAEIALLESKHAASKQALEEVKTSINGAATAIKSKQAEITAKKKAVAAAESGLSQNTEEVNALKQEEPALVAKVKALTAQIEDSKAMQSSSKAKGAVLSALMDCKAKGSLPGVYGRLGDLGSIPDEYDVAISSSCGALDHIVVDTTETAQQCVAFLRAKKLGVAVFIISEKIEHLRSKAAAAFDCPNGATRLFDVIRTKDEFRTAFYFAVQNTLVAKDLDTASKWAYNGSKRHRVVTLGGQVIESSGAMTGGGKTVAKGGMRKAGAGDVDAVIMDVAAVERELLLRKEDLAKLRARLAQLNTLTSQGRKELDKLSVEIPKLEMEVDALGRRRDEAQSELAGLEKAAVVSSSEAAKLKELSTGLKANQKALEKAKSNASKFEKEIAEMQAAILDVGGSKVKLQKARVEALAKQLDDAQTVVAKGEVQLKAAQKNSEKAKKASEEAKKEAEAVTASIEKLKEEFSSIEEAALKVMEAFKNSQENLEKKKVYLAEIEAEYEELKAVVSVKRGAEVDVSNQLDDVNKALKENTSKATHWRKKVEQLLREAAEEAPEVEETVEVEREATDDDEDMGMMDGEAASTLTITRLVKKTTEGWMLESEALAELDVDDIQRDLGMMEEAQLKMRPNMAAIEAYRSKSREVESRMLDLQEVTKRRDAARKEHDALRKQRLDEFMSGFGIITMRLKEMYQMITLGGDAELELVDSLDPFTEGIVFSVRPPKKSWKNISHLSGGEKTLSSLSLVFALHHFKPTPLYVMDEIDAALDFQNVSIVANYIKDRTKDAQFIIISLRNNMFELADRLVGIYKTHNATKSVAVNPAMLAGHLPQAASVDA